MSAAGPAARALWASGRAEPSTHFRLVMAEFSDKLGLGQLFEALSPQELKQLEFRTKCRSVEDGEFLCREGETGDEVYMILSGRARVEAKVPDSSEAEVLAALDEGEFVGEMVMLGQYYRSASVIAEEDLEVLVWSKDDLDAVFEQNHHIGYVVMRNLANSLADRLKVADTSLMARRGTG